MFQQLQSLSLSVEDKEKEIWKKKYQASLKSSDYYWPEPEPVALRATGQVSTLTELG